jgi:dipeptidyl aminopeptidase/acylaminoacyl peptidase
MTRFQTAVIFFILTVSCSDSSKSIQEIKNDFGDFQTKSIKLLPADYTKAPIFKTIEHQPENYGYLNDVDIYRMGHMSDGLFLTGFLVAPKKAGKYPVIVVNRGGNGDLGILLVATAVDVMAPLAAQGYVVVATNYRGNSRSEGSEQFGGSDVADVKNLIHSLTEIEMADADRIGLLGISRGGMMNYLTVKGDTSTNIRALVNIGGITDLSRTIEHHAEIGDVANELIPEFEANRDMEIKKRSAIYWTHELPKNIPILLLHSKDDQHVHYSQIPQFADSLQLNGVPYKLVSFENDKHGLLNHDKLVRELIMDWFNLYVRDLKPFESDNIRETIE